jgi:hypothetical protein
MSDIITRRATEVWSVPVPKRITCLDCGRKLRALGGHLSKCHNMTSGQYRKRHGLVADYPLQVKEPPAPQSEEPRIVNHVKDFHLGLQGGLTCSFELPLPQFSLAMMSSTNRRNATMISDVREACRDYGITVWVSIREFQSSVILETGRGTRFRLIIFQFSKKTDMVMCRLRFSELW